MGKITMMYTYSIMIMSHDNYALLEECIKLIRAHTPFPFELIIIDDASEPPYSIPDVIMLRMPKRSNCCNLRNTGMEMATSDYVFLLDNVTISSTDCYMPVIVHV